MDIEEHLEQKYQVRDLTFKIKQDTFLPIPPTPLVKEQDLRRDLNTPSPQAQTPPPPSTSPIGYWDSIDNYPTTCAIPPPIQENPHIRTWMKISAEISLLPNCLNYRHQT